MKDGSVQLGDIAGKITMLEIACSRCERRDRLLVAQLIQEHGADMGLPELRYILPSDCARAEAASVSAQCDVYYPQLRPIFDP
jgi:hypothetical protein